MPPDSCSPKNPVAKYLSLEKLDVDMFIIINIFLH